MAGLSVVLEAQKTSAAAARSAQIVSKATLLSSSRRLSPTTTAAAATTTSSFLQTCFLCRKPLSHAEDIYMYRGDRAFCSVECRRSQIFMDEEESVRRQNCSLSASPAKRVGGGGRHAGRSAVRGGFAY